MSLLPSLRPEPVGLCKRDNRQELGEQTQRATRKGSERTDPKATEKHQNNNTKPDAEEQGTANT
jgi:hypothetical protein